MKIRCIIVDDEQLARDLIRGCLEKLPEFEIVADCANAVEAFRVISRTAVDLMFLDIQMPEITGVDFLKNIKNPPQVIITTAHREYALEGFELDVVDYLLKPIRFERFLKAIDKFESKGKTGNFVGEVTGSENDYINIRADRKVYKVDLAEILYIESERDYIKITTHATTILSKQTLSGMEKQLPAEKFIRIHRSIIVALDQIDSFDSSMLEIGKRQFPIGRSYSGKVWNVLGK